MSALLKYLNHTPSMCDLQFYTDAAHTERTFCSRSAKVVASYPINVKEIVMFFSSEVTAVIIFFLSTVHIM